MRILKFVFLLMALSVTACQNKKRAGETAVPGNGHERVVLAYVTSWGKSMPDPSCMTHINYAFAHVSDDLKGVRIDNESRLRAIVGLKKEKPSLKVLLAIGGWGSSRFSEMAYTDSTRIAFATNCKQVIDRLGLDGIDIDWEYPGNGSSGISSSPDDIENYTLLMRDIRKAIGKDKLLIMASDAQGMYYDFKAIKPYVDFVNIVSYDMEESPRHHAALFCSDMTGEWSCQKAVEAHVKAGFPTERLVLGIPFHGHGTNEAPELLSYRHIVRLDSLQCRWDSIAKVPYLVNSEGRVLVNYEDARSIRLKCQFLHQLGMLGAMYWEYDSDDEQGTLRKAVYQGVMQLP